MARPPLQHALRELRAIYCSGRINSLEFDLPNIEIIDLAVDPDVFEFGVVKSGLIEEDDQKQYFRLPILAFVRI
jgi:hypothetical protein